MVVLVQLEATHSIVSRKAECVEVAEYILSKVAPFHIKEQPIEHPHTDKASRAG